MKHNKGNIPTGSTTTPPKLDPGPLPEQYDKNEILKKEKSHQQFVEDVEEIICDGEIEIAKTIDLEEPLTVVSFTDDLLYMACGTETGSLLLYDTEQGNFHSELRDTSSDESSVTAIRHRPVTKDVPMTSTLTCTYACGYVCCWHYPSGRLIYVLQEGRQVNNLCYHQRQLKFITVGEDAQVFLYDEETLMKERVFKSCEETGESGHKGGIYGASFHPRNPFEFITGGLDETIQFWDIRCPTAVRFISGVYITGDGLDINRTGKNIISCSYRNDDALQIWDYASAKLIMTLNPDIFHPKLYCGKWTGKDKIVCGGKDPNILRIIDYKLGATLGSLRGFTDSVTSLDKAPSTSNQENNFVNLAFITGTEVHRLRTSFSEN